MDHGVKRLFQLKWRRSGHSNRTCLPNHAWPSNFAKTQVFLFLCIIILKMNKWREAIGSVDVNSGADCTQVFIPSRCLDREAGSTQTLETPRPVSCLWVEGCWTHVCWKLPTPVWHFFLTLLPSATFVGEHNRTVVFPLNNQFIINMLITCKHDDQKSKIHQKSVITVAKLFVGNPDVATIGKLLVIKKLTLWFYFFRK